MTWPSRSEGVSIVIPTYNERDNIQALLAGLSPLSPLLGRPVELILVDDQSPDGTGEYSEQIARNMGLKLRVLIRCGGRSMGGAIAVGLRACRWDLACVMDADLSHPPMTILGLVEALDGADGVVASRYVPGSQIGTWPVGRRLTSLAATWIAKRCLRISCRDPLSGFFLFRRSFLEGVEIKGQGNKPLLEILVAKRPVVREVPYLFQNRANGESKLNARAIFQFVRLVASLWYLSRKETGTAPSGLISRGQHSR